MKAIQFSLVLLLSFACKNEVMINPDLADQRSFYMGFTIFPYDISAEAIETTMEEVSTDGDILLTHLDTGVPWNEALNGSPFPADVIRALDESKNTLQSDMKLFLTTTPTDQSRNHLARYWNHNGEHQDLPLEWKDKPFDDPDVIQAFSNYCKRIIDYLDPDYFAYSIEINNSFQKGSENFENYLELAESVYLDLKQTYPDLPIMLTLQSDSFENSRSDLLSNSERLLQFSDYVAMSTYPFLTSEDLKRDANPELFPNDWLKVFRDLAPEKPFVVSETAFIAEDIELESVGIRAKASEEWQKDYLQKLMLQANALEAEFVCWFVYRDYDAIYDLVPIESFRIWRDTGLKDEDGRKRESYDLWKEWMEVDKI